jgi:hypothetical protein
MMQFTCCDGAYSVVSHGNGWAYEVTDQSTGETLWFQDSDADQLRTDTGDFEHRDAIAQYFELLGE